MIANKTEQAELTDKSTLPDETMQKKAENTLSESEAIYKSLFENNHAVMLIIDPDNAAIVDANPAACAYYGWSREEIKKMRIDEINTLTREEVFSEMQAAKSAKRNHFVFRHKLADGMIRDVEVFSGPITLHGKAMLYSIVHDISERKMMEEEHKLLHNRFLTVLDSIDATIYVADIDSYEILFMNRHIKDAFGGDFTGKLCWKVFRNEAGPCSHCTNDRLRDENGNLTGVCIWDNQNPITGKWYKNCDRAIMWIDGRIVRLQVAMDITELKNSEAALRKSEEKYRLIFEYSPLGLLYFDENGVIVDCNDNFVKIIGSSKEKLIGLNMMNLPDKKIAAAVRKALGGSTGFYEGNYHSVTAEKITPLRVIFAPLNIGNGDVPGGMGIIEDVTGRKKAEEELLKADKLESVGILAGGIAHDFNNILTSIVGNISVARMHVEQGSKIFNLLNAAETAAMRAGELTGQLLTFARGGTPVKEIVAISRLIKELSLFVLQGSKAECEFFIAEDLWPVEADVGQIRQVISNILINANQAMPEGGIIRIAADNLMLEEGSEIQLKPGRYIRLSIKDHGSGIEEKNLTKIFDPYFTTKNAGSGLGLTAAYSIIKQHNGHITIDSLEGAGTTFFIYLPALDSAVPVKNEADLVQGAGKILFMDDDSMLREMANAMLEMLGYDREFAKDGAEAIEMYSKAIETGKPYDVVVLDLTIPGAMGGKEAVKKLLELDPELKAVVCSGYSDDPVMSNYHEYGFKGKMAKPFDFKTLSRVLNDVIKGERQEA